MRRILDCIKHLNISSHKVKLDRDFKKDISWWMSYLKVFNGVYYNVADKELVMHTDACDVGGSAFLSGDWVYVNWAMDMRHALDLHINHKEVLEVLSGVLHWAHTWTNAKVTVVTDSTVTKAIINKGTCKNAFVMDKLRHLFWLSVRYNFKLHAVHVPGLLNNIPDSISRLNECGQNLYLFSLLSYWHHGYFQHNLANHMCCRHPAWF